MSSITLTHTSGISIIGLVLHIKLWALSYAFSMSTDTMCLQKLYCNYMSKIHRRSSSPKYEMDVTQLHNSS